MFKNLNLLCIQQNFLNIRIKQHFKLQRWNNYDNSYCKWVLWRKLVYFFLYFFPAALHFFVVFLHLPHFFVHFYLAFASRPAVFTADRGTGLRFAAIVILPTQTTFYRAGREIFFFVIRWFWLPWCENCSFFDAYLCFKKTFVWGISVRNVTGYNYSTEHCKIILNWL